MEPMCGKGLQIALLHTHKIFDIFFECPHVLEQIFTRFVGMLRAMQMSDNAKIKCLAKHVVSSPTRITASNLD